MRHRAAMEAALRPVVEFQQRFGVPIYVGEFSAIRWAPNGSAARYLRDAIAVFESHGWDWSYHAFREWQGWSVEHDEDPAHTNRASFITERQQILRDAFARNEGRRNP